MKEELKSNHDTMEQLKSTDTAIVLYDSKLEEIKEMDQKKDDVIEEQKISLKKIEDLVRDKDDENSKLSEKNEELAR